MRVAVERHATSKIRRSEDLEGISTLGFRGEALPSIASVSHFVLRSRARGAASGTEIRINGGAVASVSEIGMAEGTAIEVADLFYNLPARRKFLKSDGAESAQVSRIVTQLALCYPEIGFTLTSAGRKVIQCPPVGSLRDRSPAVRRTGRSRRGRSTGESGAGYMRHWRTGPTRGPQKSSSTGDREGPHHRARAHRFYSVASSKSAVRGPLFITMPPASATLTSTLPRRN